MTEREHTSTTVSLTQFARRLEYSYLSRGAAVIGIGAPGNGKTSVVNRLARKLQKAAPFFGACGMNIGGAQSIDVIGLPSAVDGPLSRFGMPGWLQPDNNPKVQFRGAFKALTPDHMRHPDDATRMIANPTFADLTDQYARGIVVFDEIATGDDTVWQPVCQVMYDGAVGHWGVDPTKWLRVGLCNAVEHQSMAREIPANLRNRCAILHIRTLLSDFEPYWREEGMHQTFLSFAAEHSDAVLHGSIPATQEQFSTARSWMEAWADCMAYCRYDLKIPSINPKGQPYNPGLLPDMSDADGRDTPEIAEFTGLVAARCGEGVALDFATFLKDVGQMPKLADILAKPSKIPVPTDPGVLHAMLSTMAAEWSINEVEDAAPFLMRVPPAMGTYFCTRFNERNRGIGATSTVFGKLVNAWGVGARANSYAAA